MDESDTILVINDHVSEAEAAEPNEEKIETQNIFQIIRQVSSACDQKNIGQIKKLRSNHRILRNNQLLKSLPDKIFSTSQTANKFKRNLINSIIDECYNEFLYDKNQLFFVAAAKLELDELDAILETFSEEDINQLKNTDSVLIFVLKFADLDNEKFLKCIEILIDRGVNVNKYDGTGKTAIDHVALLYEWYLDNNIIRPKLITTAAMLLKKNIYETDNKITLDFIKNVMKIKDYKFRSIDDESKLFYWIAKNNTTDFLNFQKFKNVNINCDNGESTLLQLASGKSDNMSPIVQCLLKNKANPNKVTKWNTKTPLELAALRNHQQIFELLLKCKETKIDQAQYNNFVRWRLHPMKSKLFEILLESDKINPTFIFEKTGNTPLHYAVIFSHKKAIHMLLKRGSSLIIKNKLGKRALDIIDPSDLEIYFDSCLALDNYTPYFSDIHYKMKFRFHSLIDHINSKETNVVAKIGKSANLKHLLSHPFIHTYINLKWFKMKFYFYLILLLQALLFITLGFLFYDLPAASPVQFGFAIAVGLINIILKGMVFLNFKIVKNLPIFFAIVSARLHGTMELLLIITIIGSFFQDQFRAFLYIEMAISFLLAAGYHPKLSKWSVMLQKVFKTFSILLIFFSLLVIGFSAGFRVLFHNDDKFFGNFTTSIFKTFIMTTGEFETGNANFNSEFSGYLLFLLFAMSMSLVIVNFWTGVAVTDIERIEKESATNAFKNVIIFMKFVDYVYAINFLNKIRKYLRKPLLFLDIDSENTVHYSREKTEIDFFVNRSKQFEGKDLPAKLDSDCFNKIRLHYYKIREVPTEQKMLTKLEELTKALNELKSAIKLNETGRSDSKPKFSKERKKQDT